MPELKGETDQEGKVMYDPLLLTGIICLYIGILFLVAIWIERSPSAKRIINNPVVYSLSLGVYCTAWTFYGSIGKAATSGMLFVTIYLGPVLTIVLWWIILRKLVKIKERYRITSIADFISARYNKSMGIAAAVTLIALIGITPYIALQLKAIISTFRLIADPDNPAIKDNIGLIVVVLMTLFTIILGIRRLDPTERHPGMIMVIAIESVIKLFVFLVAGFFITYIMYDGFGDIIQKTLASGVPDVKNFFSAESINFIQWGTYLVLAMSAILFLPRQFHVSVVENFDVKHIKTAMWLFPLYMFLINIFVLPVALAGHLMGYPADRADNFLLLLPLYSEQALMVLLVFIGGLSASSGMIMISSMTMSTMITNHLLLPVVDRFDWLKFLRRHLLKCRWLMVALFITTGYLFEKLVGESYMLVNIGMISFAAVFQFAPAILGGIFWRRGNGRGASLGIGSGFFIWFYTLMLPSFVRSGWIGEGLLEQGLFGIAFLRPEQLFGLTALDPLSHTLFWSAIFNIGFYILGSLSRAQGESEQMIADDFTGDFSFTAPSHIMMKLKCSIFDIDQKKEQLLAILKKYLSSSEASNIIERSLSNLKLSEEKMVSVVKVADLCSEVERSLAGIIGSAASYRALRRASIFTEEEEKELTSAYGEILAGMKVSPGELKERIDYYRERENLLQKHSEELTEKIKELEREIKYRKEAELSRDDSELRFRAIFDQTYQFIGMLTCEGILIEINKTALDFIDCKESDVIGKSFRETPWWTHSAGQQKLLSDSIARAASGEFIRFEATHVSMEGREHYIDFSIMPVRDCLLYTSPSPRDVEESRMPSSA